MATSIDPSTHDAPAERGRDGRSEILLSAILGRLDAIEQAANLDRAAVEHLAQVSRALKTASEQDDEAERFATARAPLLAQGSLLLSLIVLRFFRGKAAARELGYHVLKTGSRRF